MTKDFFVLVSALRGANAFPYALPLDVDLRWIKPVSMLPSDALIRRVFTTTFLSCLSNIVVANETRIIAELDKVSVVT